MQTKSMIRHCMMAGAFLLFYSSTAFCETDHKKIADEHLRNSETSLAIAEYKTAITLNPSSTALYFNLAIACYNARSVNEAATALEKLVALDPNDVEAYYNLACLKLCQHDPQAAKLCFEKAKSCCNLKSKFFPLVDIGLEFMDQLKTLDPQTQDALFTLLTQSLPSERLSSTH